MKTRPVETKKILKAAKKAGIDIKPGKGSHIKLTHPSGKTFSLSNSGKKEVSVGVSFRAWAFIEGNFDKAY